MVLALLHSTSALTAVGWKLQWCGPNIALFQYETDTYFKSDVIRWDPSESPNSWRQLTPCQKPYVAISFQPKSPASGSMTIGINSKNAGRATLFRGEPGYSPHLDPDGDGFAYPTV
ncbi:hypothetical protein BGZ96_002049 [Linnemannia gamsii]|uniref:Excalibur calcium-binding domain-containing protein n=1 Tax=Linnemannia gamsii TaxID=64522 RepID=A0ABQ7KA52_9FUNG|nr:hypothetical protein BGZ96_002049 [Linnemannia gamsii]